MPGKSDDQVAMLVNPWNAINIALPLSYFAVGFAMSFSSTPLSVYAVEQLRLEPDKLQVLSTIAVSSAPPDFVCR
jgi:hypothetical protein